MKKLIYILPLMLLTFCGKQSSEVSQVCSTQAVANGTMITCPDGSSQLVVNGQTGLPGIQGPLGPVGPTGASGSIVQTIQFCPGVPNYGSFFEVGFCIDHNLYAVYWAGSAFLTLLSPGTYVTTTSGANCNFTVLTDCQIHN